MQPTDSQVNPSSNPLHPSAARSTGQARNAANTRPTGSDLAQGGQPSGRRLVSCRTGSFAPSRIPALPHELADAKKKAPAAMKQLPAHTDEISVVGVLSEAGITALRRDKQAVVEAFPHKDTTTLFTIISPSPFDAVAVQKTLAARGLFALLGETKGDGRRWIDSPKSELAVSNGCLLVRPPAKTWSGGAKVESRWATSNWMQAVADQNEGAIRGIGYEGRGGWLLLVPVTGMFHTVFNNLSGTGLEVEARSIPRQTGWTLQVRHDADAPAVSVAMAMADAKRMATSAGLAPVGNPHYERGGLMVQNLVATGDATPEEGWWSAKPVTGDVIVRLVRKGPAPTQSQPQNHLRGVRMEAAVLPSVVSARPYAFTAAPSYMAVDSEKDEDSDAADLADEGPSPTFADDDVSTCESEAKAPTPKPTTSTSNGTVVRDDDVSTDHGHGSNGSETGHEADTGDMVDSDAGDLHAGPPGAAQPGTSDLDGLFDTDNRKGNKRRKADKKMKTKTTMKDDDKDDSDGAAVGSGAETTQAQAACAAVARQE